ncbi:MAG: hypothetical protein Q7J54_04165 [Candidatus Woesearchaeota archaeon]|nr:hypothetical protein [Candidatus Woesearchaeota archaeon]
MIAENIKMDVNELVKRANVIKNKGKVDLSSDEDLSIALMNLISIEEHMYFSAMKTNKKLYLDLLNQIRELRKNLLKEIVKEPEGEVWCISKHLLGASMRLIEVGNKHLNKDENKAQMFFKNAFDLYTLFWSLNLKLIKSGEMIQTQGSSWKEKLANIVKKVIDCCKE